ncbi:MAG: HYR domain-containing protein [Saprospiraceae bacterium]
MKPHTILSAFFSVLFYFACCNSIDAHQNPSSPGGNIDSSKVQIGQASGIDPYLMDAKLGHCEAKTVATVNCFTHTIELSAYVHFVFTGQLEPIVAKWSTGQTAHKITVSPPGVWSWDPSTTGCEPNHWHTEYNQPGTFFTGNLDIQGPAFICTGDVAELSVESGGYEFQDYIWDPANPGGNIPSYQISTGGTYYLVVSDDLNCSLDDEIFVASSNPVYETESISFCTGESVTIGGQVYTQSGTVIDTIPSNSNGCDTIITYTLTEGPYQIRSVSISFCPGESVTIDGQVYTQSATVTDTLPSAISCDTIVTYTLTLVPFNIRSETISFCPGQTVTLGGTNYTQPGTVVLTLPSSTGCDTIATYTLQFLTPAASNVSMVCPASVKVTAPFGSTGAVVNYSPAIATSNCPCPGIQLSLTAGLAPGSNFPEGITPVCYQAKDSCGQTASCCFNVTVEVDAEAACDTKVSGCLKYEILTITADMAGNRTYRIRVTNNCADKLIYSAFQLPSGVVAIEPANLSLYSAPSGNTYQVRNPSHTPLYSIRYSSVSDSLQLGESDIFKYTLPKQTNVTFIQALSRLAPNIYNEAKLNTFNCPIGVTPSNNLLSGINEEETAAENLKETRLMLFPNPASQNVRVLTGGQTGALHILDQTGRVVLRQFVGEPDLEFSIATLPEGLYQVIFMGEKTVLHSPLTVHR